MIVKEIFPAFLAYKARHNERTTVRFYDQRLRLFASRFAQRPFCSAESFDRPDTGIMPLEIDEYLAEAGEGLRPTTRAHNVVALRTLQSWAIEQRLLE